MDRVTPDPVGGETSKIDAVCQAIHSLATQLELRGAVESTGKVFDLFTRDERRRLIVAFLAAEARLRVRVIAADVVGSGRHPLTRMTQPTPMSNEDIVALLRTLAETGLEELCQARVSTAAILVPPLFSAESRHAILARIDLRLMALRRGLPR